MRHGARHRLLHDVHAQRQLLGDLRIRVALDLRIQEYFPDPLGQSVDQAGDLFQRFEYERPFLGRRASGSGCAFSASSQACSSVRRRQ